MVQNKAIIWESGLHLLKVLDETYDSKENNSGIRSIMMSRGRAQNGIGETVKARTGDANDPNYLMQRGALGIHVEMAVFDTKWNPTYSSIHQEASFQPRL